MIRLIAAPLEAELLASRHCASPAGHPASFTLGAVLAVLLAGGLHLTGSGVARAEPPPASPRASSPPAPTAPASSPPASTPPASTPAKVGQAPVGGATTPTPPAVRARELARQANRLYAMGEVAAALLLYREAYQLSPRPKLLFNMAQCERLNRRPRQAVTLYRQFLSELPDAPNAADVRRLIGELEAQANAAVAAGGAGSGSAPGSTGTAVSGAAGSAAGALPLGGTPGTAAGAPGTPTALSTTAPAAGASAAAASTGAVSTSSPGGSGSVLPGKDSSGVAGTPPVRESVRWHRRWYVWAAVGAVVVAVVVGSAAGAAASSGSSVGLPQLGSHPFFGGR